MAIIDADRANNSPLSVAYLGAPYSDPNPQIKNFRLRAVTKMAYDLFKQGRFVYSPLTHNAPIDSLGIFGDYAAWMDFDHNMLSKCDSLLVFKLPGWENSKGLAAEIKKASTLGLKIDEIIPTNAFLEDLKQQTTADNDSLQLLDQAITQMVKERDWDKFHSPKNVAMSLHVEAGELAEHFTWLSEEASHNLPKNVLAAVAEEAGDVFVNLVSLCNLLGIDLFSATFDKLVKIKAKYPVFTDN